MQNPGPHFLSTAVVTHILKPQQARDILDVQRSDVEMGLYKRNVGEIARELAYMSGKQCDEVEAERCKVTHQKIPDAIIAPEFWSVNTVQLISAAAIITFSISLLATSFDLDKAGITSGIIALLVGIAPGVLPQRLRLAIRRRPVRTAFITALPLSAGGVLCISILLGNAISGHDLPRASELLAPLRVLSLTVVIVTVLMALNIIVQTQERRYLSRRFELMARLEIRVQKFLASESQMSKESITGEIVRMAAAALADNPWLAYPYKLFLGLKGRGTVSLWYMVPGQSDKMEVSLIELPGATQNVERLFDVFRNQLKTAALDEVRYKKALGSCRDASGRFDRKKFFSIPDRAEYISLAGYVFAKQQAQYSGDVGKCLAFDETFYSLIEGHPLSSAADSWIRFRSVAAYPVVSPEGRPVGVLMAIENVKNGINEVDRGTLCTAARLLGAVNTVLEHSRRFRGAA